MPTLITPKNSSVVSSALDQRITSIRRDLAKTFDSPRILVADDDPATADLIGLFGSDNNYQIVRVADGREAYRLLRADANFAVAVFNMTMPHLQGEHIVSYMKTEKRLMRIPVIVVSDSKSVEGVAASFRAGAIAFLPKPFSTQQLHLTLRLALCAGEPRAEMSKAA